MLVMRRRAGEGFLIGPDVEIEILEISPTRVKIGIVAPNALQIVRKEVLLTREENLAAAHNAAPQTIAWLSQKLSKPSGPPQPGAPRPLPGPWRDPAAT